MTAGAEVQAPITGEQGTPISESGGRDRRPRDRYGRDRRQRQPAESEHDVVVAETTAPVPEPGEQTEEPRARKSYFDLSQQTQEPDAEISAANTTPAPSSSAALALTPDSLVVVETADATSQRTVTMPSIEPYQLPHQELESLASSAGLIWVNSDAVRVAQAQAAILAEPRLPHIPRERPAPVPVDDRPLVLVETRLDLHAVRLPFEESTRA